MSQPDHPPRRPVLSVIGNGTPLPPELEQWCEELGRRAIDAGFRIACGGLGGVMAAVARGTKQSAARREGDVVGILPGYDASAASEGVDVVVPTGMSWARNVVVVAMGDAVVAVGGGSGTLSEMAYAWQLGKPIIAHAGASGWSHKLAGESLDGRRTDTVQAATSPAHAIELAVAAVRSR